MEREIPRGYVWKDGEIEIDNKQAEIVKWIYEMAIKYADNPPELLIQYTMDKYKEDNQLYEVDKLIYEEAREKVSFDTVKRYMVVELNLRLEQYEDHKQEDTPSELYNFLNNPLDESQITKLEDRFKSGYGVRYESGLFFPDGVFGVVNNVDKSLSDLGFKISNQKPLIPIEHYEEVAEQMGKYKQASNEEQDNGAMITLE